jgi:hypothetical protein
VQAIFRYVDTSQGIVGHLDGTREPAGTRQMATTTMAKRRTTSIAGKAPDNIGMLILPARAASPQPALVNAVPTDVFRQPLCPAGVVHQHRPPKDIAPDHDAVRAECAPQFIAQVTTVCGLPMAARMSLRRQKALRPNVSTWP